MADIVGCGDLEGEIEKSGELSKLKVLGRSDWMRKCCRGYARPPRKKGNPTNRPELVNTQGLTLSVIEISPTLSERAIGRSRDGFVRSLAGLDDRSRCSMRREPC